MAEKFLKVESSHIYTDNQGILIRSYDHANSLLQFDHSAVTVDSNLIAKVGVYIFYLWFYKSIIRLFLEKN